MKDFLDIDGLRRIEAFRVYDIGEDMRRRAEVYARDRPAGNFKSTSFLKGDIKYALPLHLEAHTPVLDGSTPIVLSNPTAESERKITSYIKYILRSHGILYHCLPGTSPMILQVVLPLPNPSSSPPVLPSDPKPEGWILGLFNLSKRSSSVPPPRARSTSIPPEGRSKGKERYLSCYMRIQYEGQKRRGTSRASSSTRQSSIDPTMQNPMSAMAALTTLIEAQHINRDITAKSGSGETKNIIRSNSHGRPPLSRQGTSRTASSSRIPSTRSHPHPLSRQVSTDSVATRNGLSRGLSKRQNMPSRVIITLSDERAVEAIRGALDVKLPKGVAGDGDSTSPIVVSREIIVTPDTSPEMDRGRSRSREERELHGITVIQEKSSEVDKGSRERSRGRKKGGFLEGIFGSRESSSRSASTPPSFDTATMYTPIGM
jgi:hypothetical protein